MAVSGMVWGGHATVVWELSRFAHELEEVAADLAAAMQRCGSWQAPSRAHLDRRLDRHRGTLSREAERLSAVANRAEAAHSVDSHATMSSSLS